MNEEESSSLRGDLPHSGAGTRPNLFAVEDGEVFGTDDVQGGSGNDACVVDEDDAVSDCGTSSPGRR